MRSRLAFALLAIFAINPPAARAADPDFDVAAAVPRAVVGKKANATVTIMAKNGWHMNEEAPLSVKLTPAAGVAVAKTKLTRPDAVSQTKNAAKFDVAFTASAPGASSIDAEASFVICQETACRPVKQKLVLAINVAVH